MSFILDALKKSEAERQRQAGPALIEMRIMRPARRLPAWAIIVGTLLGVGVLALAWVALRKPAPTAANAAVATAPTAGTGNAVSASATPGTAESGSTASGLAGPAAPAGGGGVVMMQGASPTLAAPAASAPPAAAGGDDNPADEAPAEAPAAGFTGSRIDTHSLRNYAELGGSLPELRLDLHVYAAQPSERYAFINMHKVREGETTAEGVMVKAITPEGVVLEYRGTEFLLGR